jgi:hypothetical protein
MSGILFWATTRLSFMESCDPGAGEGLASSPHDAKGRVYRVLTIVVSTAVLGLLIPMPIAGRSASAIGNLFHAPMFGFMVVIGLWAWNQLRPITVGASNDKRWMFERAVTMVLAMSACGVLMEAMQALTYRSSSIHDALANFSGATAGAALFVGREVARHQKSGLRFIVWVIAGSLAGLCLWWASKDAVATLVDVRRVTTQFPLLSSFETDAELRRWYFRESWRTAGEIGVTHGKRSMRVRYEASEYPGPTLVEMHRDWTSMKSLCLDVKVDENAADPVVRLVVKVTDGAHDGTHPDSFHQTFEIRRGESRSIKIDRDLIVAGPVGRDLDLGDIRYLDLMLDKPTVPTVVFFDHVRIVW